MSGDMLCSDQSGKKAARKRSSNLSRNNCSFNTMLTGVTSLELLHKRSVFSDNASWPQRRLLQFRHYNCLRRVG